MGRALVLSTSNDFLCLSLLTFLVTHDILLMCITNPHYFITPS